MFVGDWLDYRNRFTPDRCALYDRALHKKHTFSMLYRKSGMLSNFLFRTAKVNKGDRVAVLSETRIECIEIFFATAKIGGITVTLPAHRSDAELLRVISHACPVILFYSDTYESRVRTLEQSGAIRHLVKLGREENTCYEDASPLSHPVEEVELNLDDPVAILYDFDHSDELLGAIVSHGMVTWNAINTVLGYQIGESDCAPLFSPLNESAGLFMFTLPLVYAGGTTIFPGDDAPEILFHLLDEDDLTFLYMEPDLLERLTSHPLFGNADFSRLRFCISSGLCSRDITREIEKKRLNFTHAYLLNEAGPNNFHIPETERGRRTDSIGRPLIHVQAAISDSEGRMLREGEEGELLIRGHHIFSGYWNNPGATYDAFLKGWVRTHDRARCEDGFYYLIS